MNKFLEADFFNTFPPALKKDEKMAALGRIVADELHITAGETEKNIIYANIEELSETWLDVLAYDLHVEWYDYDYPIEAKRAIIRDSIRVHQKKGTKRAVEMALGGIHPKSEIEEWFDYDGKPYHFRIVLDTTKSRVAADYDEIVKTVDRYKRLTAHLDGIYYQGSVSVSVIAKTEYWVYSVPLTGQLKAGTEPYRNRAGAVGNAVIGIKAQAAGYIAESAPTGTRPYRNITFAKNDIEIVSDSDTEKYGFTSNQTGKAKAGTVPQRNTAGGISDGTVTAQAAGKGYRFESDLAGTKPDRNILFETAETAAVGQTETEAYLYENAFTGTIPGRNTVFKAKEVQTVTDTDTESYLYESDMTGQEKTGTEPYTNAKAGISENGMTTTADTESYQYEVKRCGKNRL
jgi:phage tail P2-like protein